MNEIIASAALTDFPYTLKAEHIAELLCISRSGAYTLMRRKDFPTMVLGKSLRVPKDKFIEWVNEQSTIAI